MKTLAQLKNEKSSRVYKVTVCDMTNWIIDEFESFGENIAFGLFCRGAYKVSKRRDATNYALVDTQDTEATICTIWLTKQK